MKEQKLIELVNKVERNGQILQRIFQDYTMMSQEMQGLARVLRNLPGWQEAVEATKLELEKEKEVREAAAKAEAETKEEEPKIDLG